MVEGENNIFVPKNGEWVDATTERFIYQVTWIKLINKLSIARFHAFVHLLFKGAAEGLLVLHLEVQQSQRCTARLAGWGDQDD